MNVLVVGAGSVGQVFGHHLQLAGAHVTFFVREQYVAATGQGFTLYPLNDRGARDRPVRFEDFEVLSDIAAVAERPWDHVYLCIPATGLQGAWFEALVKAVADAVLVSLTPGLNDRAYVHAHFRSERVVTGMIGFSSYPGPLEGESLPEPGTVYWFPPLMPSPFEGARGSVESVVGLLRQGGLPATVDQKLPQKVAYPTAALMSFISGLELEAWSFDALRKSARLKVVSAAIRETVAILNAHQNSRAPLALRLIGSPVFKLGLPLAQGVTPFDFEAFLRVHFLKVRAQTLVLLADYIALAEKHHLPSKHLQALAGDLQSLPEQVEAA
ncbi:MAG: hypothetical protein H0U74_02200 [Bradymonadaceae bacterium]|nr:hypothetical protein [Lujinxingiaceae bacterium]